MHNFFYRADFSSKEVAGAFAKDWRRDEVQETPVWYTAFCGCRCAPASSLARGTTMNVK